MWGAAFKIGFDGVWGAEETGWSMLVSDVSTLPLGLDRCDKGEGT
jgi:hypothetical protein